MNNNGLDASITLFLIDSGNIDSSIIFRTVHFTASTLARYHNLRGSEGLRRQQSLFQNTVDPQNSSCELENKNFKERNDSDRNLHHAVTSEPDAKKGILKNPMSPLGFRMLLSYNPKALRCIVKLRLQQ